MFLLPLQPLPGAPSVVSPESSGLLDIGTDFRDMLQNAQQHLDAEGAPPDVPMPERPVLAALMADLLEGATPPEGENSPKQIVSVLVPETLLSEGDLVVPLDQELPAEDVVPTTLDGVLPEEDVDAFSQVGKPLANTQDMTESVVSEKPSVTVPVSGVVTESQGPNMRSTVQPILSDKSMTSEPSVQPRADAPDPQLQSLPLSSSESVDAPLPVFGQSETPFAQVQSIQEDTKKRVGQEDGLRDADKPMPAGAPLLEDGHELSFDGNVQLPQQTDQEAQVSVPGFVSDQTIPHAPSVDIANREQDIQEARDQQNPNNQNPMLYSSIPLSDTPSDVPVDGFGRSPESVTDRKPETGRTVQTPLQQVISNGVPLQSGDGQVSEDQPFVATKSVLGTPEQTGENNRVSSGGMGTPSVAQIETGVESSTTVRTSPQAESAPGEQRVTPIISQAPESSIPVLPQPSQNASAPVPQNIIGRDGVVVTQADQVTQPVLQQGVPLETVSGGMQNVGSQQTQPVLQADDSSQEAVPVVRPLVTPHPESAQPVVARQNSPLISSPETQTNVPGQRVQTRPEMATLLSGEHNEVTQIPPSVIPPSTAAEGHMTQQTHIVPSESDILPQPPLSMTNVQDIQIGRVSKPLESMAQPTAQVSAPSVNMSQPVVGLEGMDDDQAVLPRLPAEVLNATMPQAPRSSEAPPLNTPELTRNSGAQTLDRSQIVSSSEAQSLNRSEFAAPLASVDISEASPEAQEAQIRRSADSQFVQQTQPTQRETTPLRMDVQTPIVQPQQPVLQDVAVTQQVQAVVTEGEVQRSVERPVANGVASSETTEARLFVAPEAQVNDDASRDQHAPSQRTVIAPQAVSEQAASVAFEEVVEQEVLLPNIDQNIDVETQSIDRIPGRPDMRVDMMNGTPRTASTLDVPQGQLNTMPAEEIDQQYRVGEQMIRNARVMTREGATQVTMRLDPQELGEVTIRLSSQDQKVSGEIAVESQKVQEIVQRNLGALREALAGQGIQLENIDVSVSDRGAQPDRETSRENLEERSGDGDGQEQPHSDSQRWEQNERQQKQTSDGQVDFMA